MEVSNRSLVRTTFSFLWFPRRYDKIKKAGWGSIPLDYSLDSFEYYSSLSPRLAFNVSIVSLISSIVTQLTPPGSICLPAILSTAGCWSRPFRIYLTSPLTSIRLYHIIWDYLSDIKYELWSNNYQSIKNCKAQASLSCSPNWLTIGLLCI